MPIKQSVFCLAACAGLAGYFHTMYENPLSPSEFKSFEFCLHFLLLYNMVKIVLFCDTYLFSKFIWHRSYFLNIVFFVIRTYLNNLVYYKVLIIYNFGPYLKVIGGNLSSTAIGVI